MAVLKCKMCGGSLDISEGMTVCECEYCGTVQTIPQIDDEKKITLFTRANRLRAACEFDKAAGVYENIVSDFPEEAEAYWGLVLCKFGIEYVDDPATGKKIPTCHRSSFESIMDDPDFEQTMENADPIARKVYREEAKTIDGIQKGILEISGKEEPYDIFICYKETDDNGSRTVDSVMAQDIYDMLTENNYRVFFARISLEDKLGTAYEPYIFAALNSARIMLAVGTDYEYYNAVWVKNEWSRFLAMMSKDRKKVLIPCYKDIDAYDIPKEFKHLQAQDMGKVGAMQDLLRGIKKILPKETAPVVQQVTQVVQQVQPASGGANVNSLLQRAQLFLEDHEWQRADEYCEKVLDIEPMYANAYLLKAMIDYRVSNVQELISTNQDISHNSNINKAFNYSSEQMKQRIQDIITQNKKMIISIYEPILNNTYENINKLETDYENADSIQESITAYTKAIEDLKKANGYADSIQKISEYSEMLKKLNGNLIYWRFKAMQQRSLFLNDFKNRNPKNRTKLSQTIYDELKNAHPLPEILKCEDYSISDMVENVFLSRYDPFTESDILSNEFLEQYNSKRIKSILSRLVFKHQVISFEIKGYPYYGWRDMQKVYSAVFGY